MTHSYVWHDTFICVTWLIHMCDMTHSYVWHDTFICVTWLIHICDMTHSYVWHDSFICVTWHIHMCDMTHSYVWHDAFICVTWLIHMCGVAHSYAWQAVIDKALVKDKDKRVQTAEQFLALLATVPLHFTPTAPIGLSMWHDSFISVNWHDPSICVTSAYGVATISRLLKIIGLFCKRAL